MSNNSENLLNEQINFQKELLFFKDDILKDIKKFELKQNSKYNEIENSIELQIKSFEEKINNITEKIANSSKFNDNIIEEKIESLYEFKEKIKEKTLSNELKIESIYNDLHKSIYKYDKMFSDSIIYPGIIGNMSKFKTFHEYIDYTLVQIGEINTFKEKNLLDLKSYKIKLENLIESFKYQINNITNSMTEFTTKCVNDCEERIRNFYIKGYNEKLLDMNLQNNKSYLLLKEEFEFMKKEWEKMLQIKKDIYYKFDNETSNIRESYNNISLKFEGYKNEFNLIKNRFTQLSEFIKDVRFRVNINNGMTKRDALNLSNKIDFSKKQYSFEQNYDSNNNIIHNIKERDYVDNLMKKYFGEKRISKIYQGRKSVINPIINSSFEKLSERNILRKQKSLKHDFIEKRLSIGNKSILNNSLNNIHSLFSPNNSNTFNKSFSLNKNNYNIDEDKIYDNNDKITENNSDESSEFNDKINIKKVFEKKLNNDKKSKINKNNSVKFSIGEHNSPKNNNSESNFSIYSEEFSLIQSKSLTNFPKLLKNTKDKYYIEQNIKNLEQIEDHKPILKMSKTTRKDSNNKLNISNIDYSDIQKNIIKIDGNELKYKNEIKKNNNKKNQDKKISKIQSYYNDIKVHIPEYNIFKNKINQESDYHKYHKNFKYNKKENLISNKTNVSKTQTYLKNKKNGQSNSQDKIFNNYYYNLMIKDDDVHKINVNLKKFP